MKETANSASAAWWSTRSLLALAVIAVLTFLASMPGAFFPPGEWYRSLEKPSWNPPDAVFAPVWTTLYILMAVAAWLVWRRRNHPLTPVALALYGLQLLLNALWTGIFFGAQTPGAAFFELLALLLCIILTSVWFWRIRVLAGVLLAPYVFWVAFAGVLNFSLWQLNSG